MNEQFIQCVCMIKSILSINFYAIYGAVCFQLIDFPCEDCENMCTLSCYHNQIGCMNNKPLLKVRSCINGNRDRSYSIIIKVKDHIGDPFELLINFIPA